MPKVTVEGLVMMKDVRKRRDTDEQIFYVDMFQEGELKLFRADIDFADYAKVNVGDNVKCTGTLMIWTKGSGYTFKSDKIEKINK